MTVAINCWILRNKKLDGIGYFTVNAVANLIKNHPEVQFKILCDKKFTEDYFDFANVTKHKIFPALRHPLLYVFYMEVVLPFFLRKHKPDVMVSADGYLSLSSSCKQIPIIYDINFEHKPGDIKLKNRIYFKFFFKRFARKAKRIATISEYSKKDIADYYKLDSSTIDNVSCGINSNFSPLDEQQISEVKNKWSGGKPYYFFVGSMHPRKNIKRLIDAFNLFKQKTGSNFKLILAGSILWSKTEIEDSYTNSPYKEDIIFTGRLSDEDLQKMLGAAYALSFVPIFEGFGLPIVEAFQSGVPVICSNVTSMPEVAGNAALMVDPFSIDSIAEGMVTLSKNNELRNQLIAKGHIQKQLFSWSRTAGLLWESICKVTGVK
ncbi:MAG: glycosyltransferase family 4 protein [Chitinophagaceae bacterium]|jgi:glycosyltransferase involved in cell wall biosynthesis|nr:glycosyltransferase family 4 protein [Chitinophagaceae bacterium]MBK7678145.1 glycosyltransferase family 4 protein [Chitinophagaceae bacterium]MBK9464481.1 glycosyltransferase family 4 protein [Chitinophagaceae bacterium]MBK9938887.1 glycosyltransferase family 4 protein [Chitinophagaceae bacterium]MBP6233576.1 glycosyltransferase family 4 protein [Chitinophagaceae bacterium]